MTKLAGCLNTDLRPLATEDRLAVSSFLAGPDRLRVSLYERDGLVMGHTAGTAQSSLESSMSAAADGTVCTWDGRLDNSVHLPIPEWGHTGGDAFDSVFAVEAYHRRGVDGLRDLIGDWSLALWDENARRLVLASDYAGIRPLYYYQSPHRILWSTRLSDLVRWTGLNELDDEFIATFLTRGASHHRTPYRGILAVPAGHAVIVASERVARRPFWSLPAGQETRFPHDRDYEERLRELFTESVQARMRHRGTVCAELSGGLDSSSIVCMAARLKQQGASGNVVTFSYTHESAHDNRYFGVVEQACDCRSVHLPLEQYPFVEAESVGDAFPGWWEPRFREVARQMEALGSSVMLTGQMGDFIMGNTTDDADQVADYLRNRQFREAAHEAFSWSQSLRVPIYGILWRALRTNYSSWAAPSVAQTMCDTYGHEDSIDSRFRSRVGLSDGDSGEELHWQAASPGRRRRFRALAEILSSRTLQVPESLQHISYTHPFAHRPLVEFMLTIPPRQICRPGEPRRLMRRAFGELLPPAILKRRSKASYQVAYRNALMPLTLDLMKQPSASRLVEFGYVNRKSFVQRLNLFHKGLDCNESQLRQLILFEFWLRRGEAHGSEAPGASSANWVH